MFESFFQKFNAKVPITTAEMEWMEKYLTPKKLRKKQYLLQEGDVCKSIAFITKGV
jgi:CRP-like cAMP-binding protein